MVNKILFTVLGFVFFLPVVFSFMNYYGVPCSNCNFADYNGGFFPNYMGMRYGVYAGGNYYHYTPNINLYSYGRRINSGYYPSSYYNQMNRNRDYSRQYGNYYWQYYSNINSRQQVWKYPYYRTGRY